MFKMRLAELDISVDNKYEYIKNYCRDYLIKKESCDLEISVSEADIQNENGGEIDKSYLESLAIYRKIAEAMPEYNGFLIHGVLMETDNKGILLCAKSGVGKSTHAALWKELFKDRCHIINGDKPLIRIFDDMPFGYGTPWCGKENIQLNKKVLISHICFIERSDKNSVEPLNEKEALMLLFNQIYLTKNHKSVVLDLITVLIKNVRFYKIKCNKELSAAKTAYDALWE